VPDATHACRETANWDAACADARKTPPKRARGVSRKQLPTPDPLLPEAHDSLISSKTIAEVPLTGLSFLLGDKQAARILFERIAPRFTDRPGEYTRILKLATPRLGDAGPRAILEFVGSDMGAARAPAPRVEARPART